MSRKPQLSEDVLQAVLRREVSPAAGPLVPLAEGEEFAGLRVRAW